MSRIHPSSENKRGSDRQLFDDHDRFVCWTSRDTSLTVWKRSSMSFQGTDGFTVYDRHGRLAFRVDNYSRNTHISTACSCSSLPNTGGTLVLMDGSGKPLITLKPQIFSIQNQWNGCIYKEDENGSSKSDRRLFTMRRPSSSMFSLRQNQCEAEVFFTKEHQREVEAGDGPRKASRQPDYRIEGSFWNRNCKIMRSGEVAAKITRKRNATAATSTIMLSEEVFRLVVKPGFDPQLIMAFVVILDRICFKPVFPHLICRS